MVISTSAEITVCNLCGLAMGSNINNASTRFTEAGCVDSDNDFPDPTFYTTFPEWVQGTAIRTARVYGDNN